MLCKGLNYEGLMLEWHDSILKIQFDFYYCTLYLVLYINHSSEKVTLIKKEKLN